MNQEQVLSIVRQILLFGGGLIVSKGWIDNTTLITVVGALVTLIGSAWAIWSKRPTGLVASAAALPSVEKIVADPAIANGTLAADPKVQAG